LRIFFSSSRTRQGVDRAAIRGSGIGGLHWRTGDDESRTLQELLLQHL
jgi:hypothetical protein